jgi:hypothetical protein
VFEDPDPPDRMTEDQIRRLAKGMHWLLRKENFVITEGPHGYTLHEYLDLGYLVLISECPSIEAANAMAEERLTQRSVKNRYSKEFCDAVGRLTQQRKEENEI